jgi:transposase
MAKASGRIPKLTQAAHDAIVGAVGKGVPITHAAALAGVHYATVARWMARGRKDTAGMYREFCDAVKRATAEAIQTRVGRIEEAATGGQVVEQRQVVVEKEGVKTTTTTVKYTRPEWTADAWVLERRHPDEFGTDRKRLAELEKLVRQLVKEKGDA